MPWVSNHTTANIAVTITKKTGGDDSVFIVKPAIPYAPNLGSPESSSTNYWTRSGTETLKVTVAGKDTTFAVQKDDHVIIYSNIYEIFTAKFNWL